jgi:hypothetical protein
MREREMKKEMACYNLEEERRERERGEDRRISSHNSTTRIGFLGLFVKEF